MRLTEILLGTAIWLLDTICRGAVLVFLYYLYLQFLS